MVKQGLYYTQDHEWVKIEGPLATIGVTDYAQNSLGEITYIELPEIGRNIEAKSALAVIESSKAASDVYSPITGNVKEVNHQLQEEPELVNTDCYGQGWIAKLELNEGVDLSSLMDAEQYKGFIGNLE